MARRPLLLATGLLASVAPGAVQAFLLLTPRALLPQHQQVRRPPPVGLYCCVGGEWCSRCVVRSWWHGGWLGQQVCRRSSTAASAGGVCSMYAAEELKTTAKLDGEALMKLPAQAKGLLYLATV